MSRFVEISENLENNIFKNKPKELLGMLDSFMFVEGVVGCKFHSTTLKLTFVWIQHSMAGVVMVP